MAFRILSTLIILIAANAPLPAAEASAVATAPAPAAPEAAVAPQGQTEEPAAAAAPAADASTPAATAEPEVTEAAATPAPSAGGTEEIRAVGPQDAGATPAVQQEAAREPEAARAEALSPMRGSTLIYRNVFRGGSLVPGDEITYNPNYSMSLRASPVWWFNDNFNIWGDVYVGGELTKSDVRTDGFYFILDSEIGAGGAYTVPGVDIDLGLDVGITFPTTRDSQVASKILGVDAELAAGRTFDLASYNVGNVSVEAAFGFGKDFHESTTPTGGGHTLVGFDCALEWHSNCGASSRNVNFSFYGRLGAAVAPVEWLSFAASTWLIQEQIYAMGEPDERISFQPLEPTDARYWVLWGLSAKVTPIELASVAVGVRGFYEQLAPSGGHRAPFFNRTTQLYVDLILNAGSLFTL